VVVADLELSPAQLGRVDTATASNGQRVSPSSTQLSLPDH
jgi:hypothetical protein